MSAMSACTGGVSSSSHNDRKIACETLADDDPPASDQPVDPSPEPLLLSAEAELDWIDRNAFIERKESAEGGISIQSANVNPNPLPPSTPSSASNFGSQRHNSSNVKSKPSVIGFPKPQKSGSYRETKNRRPTSIRLFPKRSQSSSSNSERKSGVSMAEPSSPKVSCIGRVRSKRDRSRRKKISRQKQSEQSITRSKSQKRGFWSSFRCIFRSRVRKQPKVNEPVIEPPAADPPPLGAVRRFSSARRSDAWAADLEVDCVKFDHLGRPINIGGMKRFASGRRSDAFPEELEGEGFTCEPIDPPGLGAVKRFTSGRRSDAWGADLESSPCNPPVLGAVKRFSSGRRSDAWAGDVVEIDGAKSEPSDHISILQRKIG